MRGGHHVLAPQRVLAQDLALRKRHEGGFLCVVTIDSNEAIVGHEGKAICDCTFNVIRHRNLVHTRKLKDQRRLSAADSALIVTSREVPTAWREAHVEYRQSQVHAMHAQHHTACGHRNDFVVRNEEFFLFKRHLSGINFDHSQIESRCHADEPLPVGSEMRLQTTLGTTISRTSVIFFSGTLHFSTRRFFVWKMMLCESGVKCAW